MKILGYTTSTIKEIGLCTAHDIATDLGKEAIHTQVMFHIGVEMPLTVDFNTKNSIKRIIELGGEEPLVR